jgi:hypothetical protein
MMLVGLLAVITFSPAADDFTASMQPFTQKYCLGCHSTAAKKGSLDLQRFKSSADLRGDVKVWQQTIEMLEASEMPPKGKAQPTAAERNAAIRWIRSFLDHEARSSKGDPGPSPLRRSPPDEGVSARRRRRRGIHQRGRIAFRHLADALHKVSQRRQGDRRPRDPAS